MSGETDWYKEWAGRYRKSLGLTSPEDVRMVASWRPHFVGVYTPAEMDAALTLIVRGGGVRFRDGHLKAIQQALATVRARGPVAAAANARPTPPCPRCGGNGTVHAPAPSCYQLDGSLRPDGLENISITCVCSAGRVVQTNNPHMTPLDIYEGQYPNWRHAVWCYFQARAGEGFSATESPPWPRMTPEALLSLEAGADQFQATVAAWVRSMGHDYVWENFKKLVNRDSGKAPLERLRLLSPDMLELFIFAAHLGLSGLFHSIDRQVQCEREGDDVV
jgi:hypothetical protein